MGAPSKHDFPHTLPERSHPSHCLPERCGQIDEANPNNAINGTSAARGPNPKVPTITVKPQAPSLKPQAPCETESRNGSLFCNEKRKGAALFERSKLLETHQ